MSRRGSSDNHLAMGIAFGPLIGGILGLLINNMGLELAFGIPIGMFIGLLWPALSPKKRNSEEPTD